MCRGTRSKQVCLTWPQHSWRLLHILLLLLGLDGRCLAEWFKKALNSLDLQETAASHAEQACRAKYREGEGSTAVQQYSSTAASTRSPLVAQQRWLGQRTHQQACQWQRQGSGLWIMPTFLLAPAVALPVLLGPPTPARPTAAAAAAASVVGVVASGSSSTRTMHTATCCSALAALATCGSMQSKSAVLCCVKVQCQLCCVTVSVVLYYTNSKPHTRK
jgi:hypothetical protein